MKRVLSWREVSGAVLVGIAFTLAGGLAWSTLGAAVLPAGTKTVTTEWLESHLGAEGLRIIDVRADLKDYWQGHIPGAVYLAPDALRLADHGVPVKLMPPEALAIMLGKMGVSTTSTVIAVSDASDFKATYLIWTLDYIGHPASAILDGGMGKWKTERRPMTQDYPKIDPVDYALPPELAHNVRATLDEVAAVVSSGGALIIDVRPAELYTGEKGNWKRRGHIRGSVNHFWGDDLGTEGTFKAKADLRDAYAGLGASPERLIIVSCGQGQMSSHTYFTLRHLLGYPRVKNYDGSFSEWSNYEHLPVETGAK